MKERIKEFYRELVMAIRSLPDPIEISFYVVVSSAITAIITEIQLVPTNEFSETLATAATNVLLYLKLKVDNEKYTLDAQKQKK